MNSRLGIILIVLLLIVGINIILGITFFKPEILPIGKKETITPSAPKPFSVTKLTPLSAGSPFDAPIKNPGKQTALYTVTGRISEMVESPKKDGYLIKILKDNGQFLEETPFVSKSLKPHVVYRTGGGKDISMSEIDKSDFALISLNINTVTKEVIVTAIQITR